MASSLQTSTKRQVRRRLVCITPALTSPLLPVAIRAFLEKHQKKYGEKPFAPFHAHAYDAAMMIFAAIEKVAKKGSRWHSLTSAVRHFGMPLYATKNLKGLTGNITCDKYGDCADPKIAVYKTTPDNVKKLVMPDKPIWKP